MPVIPIRQIQEALCTKFEDITGVRPQPAFPWAPIDITTPSAYIMPPNVTSGEDSLGRASLGTILTFDIYYVESVLPGVVYPGELLVETQENILTSLRADTILPGLDAYISAVTSSIENEFTRWSRMLSKPYVAVSFSITVMLNTEAD